MKVTRPDLCQDLISHILGGQLGAIVHRFDFDPELVVFGDKLTIGGGFNFKPQRHPAFHNRLIELVIDHG